ncbi:MAG: VOC family protein [Candidatus Azotimanducaceae bacterium WSBS_2022_MAG_OTU7]
MSQTETSNSSHSSLNMAHLDIVQIAYHVKDVREAAARMQKQFGAGPFILSENILLASAVHRGEATDFIHTSAYGQWGKVMVELVRQEDDTPNTPFRDMYTRDEEGLHHTAIFVDHFDAAVRQFEDSGLALVTRCKTKTGGVEFGFIDATATLGHMIELYVSSPTLLGFYEMVRAMSIDWDGKTLFLDPR